MKRAITLGGGGPAAGLHIGVLEFFEQERIEFDVWALSCIGAWVGVIYNQLNNGNRAEQTYKFFHDGVFRADRSYDHFPINTVFGPDWRHKALASLEFGLGLFEYCKKELWLPNDMAKSFLETWSLWADPKKWNEGDLNRWVLNDVLAVNPVARFLASLMYLAKNNGLSRLYYPESSFLQNIHFERLSEEGRPYIYHNAWNLATQQLELFANKPVPDRDYNTPITSASLCACSALPFVEETVKLNGATYCEGALVDTVNFKNLLEDHFDLDEIWISRIVDARQVRKPDNLHDALGNLCELFAATVGEDDVKLFKYHLQEPIEIKSGERKGTNEKWAGTIIEIHVDPHVSFKWNQKNLEEGRVRGRAAAQKAYEEYKAHLQAMDGRQNATGNAIFVNDKDKAESRALRKSQ